VFADKVKINLNMLGALMLDGVGGEVDDAGVVVVMKAWVRGHLDRIGFGGPDPRA
jgi:hypothetical protein